MREKELMRVSIITVCKNAENTIEDTINSVISQTYRDIEHIIIDGCSTDKTVSVVNKYKDKLAVFVSENDNGIYDAMNKGIRLSTGDIFYFLNANDVLLHSSVIENVVNRFLESDADVMYGDILMLEKDTGICNLKKHCNVNRFYLYANAICQQATFYRLSAFEKSGLFDPVYKIAADHEWVLRSFFKRKVKAEYMNIPVAIFTLGGLSSNPEFEKNLLEERRKVKRMYFNKLSVAFSAMLPKPFKQNLMRLMSLD